MESIPAEEPKAFRLPEVRSSELIEDSNMHRPFLCVVRVAALSFCLHLAADPAPGATPPPARNRHEVEAVLAQTPAETWLHVEIEATLGKDTPRTFRLTLQAAGGERQTFLDLPISGSDFRELHWLGFSSTAAADTAFYLDNVKFSTATARDR